MGYRKVGYLEQLWYILLYCIKRFSENCSKEDTRNENQAH